MIVYLVGCICFVVSAGFAREAWRTGRKGWAKMFMLNMAWDLGIMLGEFMK
jgi:hypothetical protein